MVKDSINRDIHSNSHLRRSRGIRRSRLPHRNVSNNRDIHCNINMDMALNPPRIRVIHSIYTLTKHLNTHSWPPINPTPDMGSLSNIQELSQSLSRSPRIINKLLHMGGQPMALVNHPRRLP